MAFFFFFDAQQEALRWAPTPKFEISAIQRKARLHGKKYILMDVLRLNSSRKYCAFVWLNVIIYVMLAVICVAACAIPLAVKWSMLM